MDAVDFEGFVDDVSAVAGDGDLGAYECCFAHVDPDEVGGGVEYLDGDGSAEGLDFKVGCGDVLFVVEVLGEDSQAVAAFLGLACVGVEDSNLRRAVGEDWSVEDSVGSDAAVSVAD